MFSKFQKGVEENVLKTKNMRLKVMYVENEFIKSSNHVIYFQIDHFGKKITPKKNVSKVGLFKSPETPKKTI